MKHEKVSPVPPEDLPATPATGLTEAEAARRAEMGLDNRHKADAGKSVGQILAGNFFSLFNMLNFALAACLILVGSYRNMLFLGVVFSNTLIGTVQELRAKRTLQRLKLLNAPAARVLREGQEKICRMEQLVLGDLVVARAGDQILADGQVVEGQGAANESLLTGESDAIGKSPGDELLSGSYLMEGRLVYRLTRVGAESYAGRLIREAKAIKPPKSVLMTDLNRLVRLVSMLLCPLGLLLFLKQFYLSHIALTEAVPTTVAAMIGMIPEGLILLTSVALAVGVVRLGGKGTLVQELYGIETLARVDTLCLDKTGTLTKGEMAVERLDPVGCTEADMRRELGRFLSAFDDPTPTLEALRRAIPPVEGVVTGTLPFSSARKKSAVAFDDGTVLVLGAPSFVMEGELPVPVRQRMEAAAGEGLRVLLLARAKGALEGESISAPLEVLGLCCLSDVIRENAADTLAYFRRQGVTVKVISGDDPRTVAHIARRVGLEGWENAVDATTLGEGAALAEAAERYTIFGRVTPAQKRELVEAMKAAGHSVAMTGDGVNDIPALKAADCSIAMAGGSDAAKNAAQLTLMNADFAAMPVIVGEGRRVINNITRAASLFLVKTLYSFLLSVLMLFLPLAYPFQPVQLTLISSLTVGIPSFFLALEPNQERVRGSFLETVLRRALPGAVAVAVCSALAMASGQVFGLTMDVDNTIACLVTALVGLLVLLRVCVPLNPARGALLAVMTAGLVCGVTLAGKVFFLVPLQGTAVWITLGLCVLALGLMLLVEGLMKRVEKQREVSKAMG